MIRKVCGSNFYGLFLISRADEKTLSRLHEKESTIYSPRKMRGYNYMTVTSLKNAIAFLKKRTETKNP
jgi:hypothetical protein